MLSGIKDIPLFDKIIFWMFGKKLQLLNIENNAIKKLPPPIHKATGLTKLLASNNRIRTLPKNIGKSPVSYIDVSGNLIKSFKKGVYELTAEINLECS
jgi:Leucine-rich repeat (LRR) protein